MADGLEAPPLADEPAPMEDPAPGIAGEARVAFCCPGKETRLKGLEPGVPLSPGVEGPGVDGNEMAGVPVIPTPIAPWCSVLVRLDKVLLLDQKKRGKYRRLHAPKHL